MTASRTGMDTAHRLARYAKHGRGCPASVFQCGASDGRRGRCLNLAVREYGCARISRYRHIAVLRRCAQHAVGHAVWSHAIDPQCTCGLAELLAEVTP